MANKYQSLKGDDCLVRIIVASFYNKRSAVTWKALVYFKQAAGFKCLKILLQVH
jgi:hypothetical protein